MVLKIVHGGQASLPDGAKKALAAVSQTTGVLVIADPDHEVVYSVATADLIQSAPNTPTFKCLKIQNKDVWCLKISFDGRHVALCSLRSIFFLTLAANGSLSLNSLQSASFAADLVDFDWSFSDASKYAAVTSDGCLYISNCGQNSRTEFRLNVTSCCWTLHSSTWLACGHRSGSVSVISASTGHILHAWPEVFPSSVIVSSVINASVLLLGAQPPGSDIIIKILELADALPGSSFRSVEDWFTGSPDPGCRILLSKIPDWDVVLLSTTSITETSILRLSRDNSSQILDLVAATDLDDNPVLLESVTNSIACPANCLAIDFNIAQLAVDTFGRPAPIALILSKESKLDFFYVLDTERQSLDVNDFVAGKALLADSENPNQPSNALESPRSEFPFLTDLSSTTQNTSLKSSLSRVFSVPVTPGSDMTAFSSISSEGAAGSVSFISRPTSGPNCFLSKTNLPLKEHDFSHTTVVFKDFIPQTNMERAFVKGLQIIDDALRSCGRVPTIMPDINVATLLYETFSIQNRLRLLLESLPVIVVRETEDMLVSTYGLFELARAELKSHDLYIQELRNVPLDDSLVNFRDIIRSSIAEIGDSIDLLRIEVDRRRLNQSQRPLQLLYSTINQNADSIARLQGELDGLSATFEEVLAGRRNFQSAIVKPPSKTIESDSKFENFRISLRDDLCRLRKRAPSVTTAEDELWELSLNLDQIDFESMNIMENFELSKSSSEISKFAFPQDDLSALESIFSDVSGAERLEELVEDRTTDEKRPVSPIRNPNFSISQSLPSRSLSISANDHSHLTASRGVSSSPSASVLSQSNANTSFGFKSVSVTTIDAIASKSLGFSSDFQTLEKDESKVADETEAFTETLSDILDAANSIKTTSQSFRSSTSESDSLSSVNTDLQVEIPIDDSGHKDDVNATDHECKQVDPEHVSVATKSNDRSSTTPTEVSSRNNDQQLSTKLSDDAATCNEHITASATTLEAETSPVFKPAFLFPDKDDAPSAPLFPTSSKAFSFMSSATVSHSLNQVSTSELGKISFEAPAANIAESSPVFRPVFSFPREANAQSAPLFPTSSNAFSMHRGSDFAQSAGISDKGSKIPVCVAAADSYIDASTLVTSNDSEKESPKDLKSSIHPETLEPNQIDSSDASLPSDVHVYSNPSASSQPESSNLNLQKSLPSSETNSTFGDASALEASSSTTTSATENFSDSSIPVNSDASTNVKNVPFIHNDEMPEFPLKSISGSSSANSPCIGQPSTNNPFTVPEQPQLTRSPTLNHTGSSDFSSGPSRLNSNLKVLSSNDSSVIQDDAMDTRQTSDITSSLESNWLGVSNNPSQPAGNPFAASYSSDSAEASLSGSLPKIQNPFTSAQINPNSLKNMIEQSSTVQTSNTPVIQNLFGQSGNSQISNPFAAASQNANSFGNSSLSSNTVTSSNPFALGGSSAFNNPFKSMGKAQPVFGQASGLGPSSFRNPFGSTSGSGTGSEASGSVFKPFGSANAVGTLGNAATPLFGSVSNATSFASFGQTSGQNSTNPGSFGQAQFSFNTANFRSRRGDDD